MGYWACECRASKEEGTATAQAAQASSCVTKQPETNPAGVARSLPIIIVNEEWSLEGGEEHQQIASLTRVVLAEKASGSSDETSLWNVRRAKNVE